MYPKHANLEQATPLAPVAEERWSTHRMLWTAAAISAVLWLGIGLIVWKLAA